MKAVCRTTTFVMEFATTIRFLVTEVVKIPTFFFAHRAISATDTGTTAIMNR